MKMGQAPIVLDRSQSHFHDRQRFKKVSGTVAGTARRVLRTTVPFPPADLERVKDKLGVDINFSVLMPKYQQLLDDIGLDYTLSMDVGNIHLPLPFRD